MEGLRGQYVRFQFFFILFYLLFATADVFIAIREYVKVHRHAMWIGSIAAALWMFCVAVAMVLKRYYSKSK